MKRKKRKKKVEDMTEPEWRAFVRDCAVALETAAEHSGLEQPGFVVVIFNDAKADQLVGTNCNRADAIKAMREAVRWLEQSKTAAVKKL